MNSNHVQVLEIGKLLSSRSSSTSFPLCAFIYLEEKLMGSEHLIFFRQKFSAEAQIIQKEIRENFVSLVSN
jgi:hypothetical protein